MILIGATAFSLVFNELGGSDIILEFFSEDIADPWVFIAFAMIIIFVLGFFIVFIEISFLGLLSKTGMLFVCLRFAGRHKVAG